MIESNPSIVSVNEYLKWVLTTTKSCLRAAFFVGGDGRRDLNKLNADVRWTSACRRLDGGNTMIESNPSISAPFAEKVRGLPRQCAHWLAMTEKTGTATMFFTRNISPKRLAEYKKDTLHRGVLPTEIDGGI